MGTVVGEVVGAGPVVGAAAVLDEAADSASVVEVVDGSLLSSPEQADSARKPDAPSASAHRSEVVLCDQRDFMPVILPDVTRDDQPRQPPSNPNGAPEDPTGQRGLPPGTYEVVVVDVQEHGSPPSLEIAVSTGDLKGYVSTITAPDLPPEQLLAMLGDMGRLSIEDGRASLDLS